MVREPLPECREPGAPVFVWGVWAAMLVAALGFVAAYGSPLPPWDEWWMASYWSGDQPVTFKWLAAMHNGHRVPLAKLVYLAVGKLSGFDSRAGMVLNVAALAALAAGLIAGARRLRGRTGYTDAIFPLALLHLGQWATILWNWEWQFVMPVVLAGVILLTILRARGPMGPGAAVLAGSCLMALPLNAGVGLLYVPALALWLGGVGVARWRGDAPHGRRDGTLILAFVAATLVLVALYFHRFEHAGKGSSDPRAVGRTVLQLLSQTFGAASGVYWPYSGYAAPALVALGLAAIALAWVEQPAERRRTLGLLAFLGAQLVLTAGLASRRSSGYWARGFLPHYILLTTPLLCVIYLAWVARGRRAGGLVQMALFLAVCLFLPANTEEGLASGRYFRRRMDDFARDLAARNPVPVLAERHVAFLFPWWPERFPGELRAMRRTGIAAFRDIPDGPAARQVDVPITPDAAPARMAWADGAAYAHDGATSLDFTLEQPTYVYAIRLEGRFRATTGSDEFVTIATAGGDRPDFGDPRPALVDLSEQAQDRLPALPVTMSGMLWDLPGRSDAPQGLVAGVNKTIGRFRVTLNEKYSVLKLQKITLLVPGTAP